MSNCIYCGKTAGLFKSKHKDCEEQNRKGMAELKALLDGMLKGQVDAKIVLGEAKRISCLSHISDSELNTYLLEAYSKKVEAYLEDGLITQDEENGIGEFIEAVQLDHDIVNKSESHQKLVKAAILRDVVNGETISRLNVSGNLPFLLQKGETLLWLFGTVDFHEMRTRTHYEGMSSGVSVRIARGVYYRTGGFRGNPVKKQELIFVAKGVLGVTEKHLYFASPTKSFKIAIAKLITITPYQDGIGLQKDGVSAKPQVFGNIDGWFAYNLISNLHSR